jgi:hypothetical protein
MPVDLTPIEELDQNILTLCTRINSATYELLIMIREFDERAGWTQWGFDNCAEWLAWHCDLSMTTAREKVRVAHALKQLPLISQAFSTGELSYSKVKAMTRVARRDNERQLLCIPGLQQASLPAVPSHRTLGAWGRDRCRKPDAAVHETPHPGARRRLPDPQGLPR